MLFDYHMHTPLCGHAVGHPREYAAEAIRKGLQEIGFSEHNPMPSKFDDWRMDLIDFPEYIRLVEEARAEFPQLPIRLGLECDFIPGKEGWIRELATKADFDYFIGAVHYITPDWDVDNPLKLARWKDQPVEEVWTSPQIFIKKLSNCCGNHGRTGCPKRAHACGSYDFDRLSCDLVQEVWTSAEGVQSSPN